MAVACLALVSIPGFAAQGEMGMGIPQFGSYSAATGTSIIVWRLDEVATPFPSGCVNITLSPTTMGIDAYKIGVATMLAARTSGRKVRFYAHAPRDGGCGVDYVELQ